MTTIQKLIKQIEQKLYNAKSRNIEAMSFDKFVEIALASPHWQNIGRNKHQYNFCRHNRSIGYTPTNTFIGSIADLKHSTFKQHGCEQLHTPDAKTNAVKARSRRHRKTKRRRST